MSHHTAPSAASATPPVSDRDGGAPRERTRRAWAWTGVVAGALGIATIQASMMTSVDWELTAGDAEAMLADAAGNQSAFLAFHVLAVLTLLILPIFGAGLKRRLDERAPAGALNGQVALGGVLLTAVVLLLGSGLDTQFALGFSDPSVYVPESAAFYTDWVATIPWVWVGAGLSAMAVAASGLRHRAVPRWIGILSLVFGILILVTGVSPFQYLAGFIGPMWVLLVSLGFALGDRR